MEEELSVQTKELIERNNEKRTELTAENEAYYQDILMYVRLKLELSEYHSEVVLIDILDQLLEGQQAEKTAVEMFGADPIAYAEKAIAALPKENKRNIVSFLLKVSGMILGPVLIIRGLLLLILSAFSNVNQDIPLITTLISGGFIILFIIAVIFFILKRLRSSLIHHSSTVKDALYIGLFVAICMGILLIIIYTLPLIGPIITFPWWASIISGVIIWLLVRSIKEK